MSVGSISNSGGMTGMDEMQGYPDTNSSNVAGNNQPNQATVQEAAAILDQLVNGSSSLENGGGGQAGISPWSGGMDGGRQNYGGPLGAGNAPGTVDPQQILQLLQTLLDDLAGGQNPAGGGNRAVAGGGLGAGTPGPGGSIPWGDSGALPRTAGSPENAPSQQQAAGGSPASAGPVAAAGTGALGPNVPSVLQAYMQDINAAAQQTGVPASLIGAQILQESGGNPNAVTTNPALGLPDTGLMQVDQATFQGLQQQYPGLLGGKSVSDPATNIMAGALLDAQLLKQNNGNIGAALTSYNGAADPNYVNEVASKMNALQDGTPVPGFS